MRTHIIRRGVLTACATLTASIAPAQDSSGDNESRARALEEVIVTARKREESIQDVPLAVTALSGEALRANHIVSVETLTTNVPSLMISPGLGSGRSTPTFSIRGQRQQEQSGIADNSVAVYVGDVAVPRLQGVNQALFDLSSVEVLKGPQGTLFGRNTTGGAILIKPNRPSDTFEGSVLVGGGDFGAFNTEGMVNIPLGEKFALRLAGKTSRRDGYVTDVVTGNEVDDEDLWAGRASLLWHVTDNIDSLFVYNRFFEDSGSSATAITALGPAPSLIRSFGPVLGYGDPDALLAAQQARDFHETASGYPPSSRWNVWDVANTTELRVGSVTIKNIAGYRSVKGHNTEDYDGLPLPLLPIERLTDDHNFSEELQILGGSDQFSWIVGAYYFKESIVEENGSYSLAPISVNAVPVLQSNRWSLTAFDAQNSSYSVFAQASFPLAERVKMTLGARNTRDVREMDSKNRAMVPATGQVACRVLDASTSPPTALDPCSFKVDGEFREPTFSASVDWSVTDDALVYLAHRHGYRSGGFGHRAQFTSDIAVPFQPETVDDVEIGLKADWFVGNTSLRTNLAFYYSDYQDIQRLISRTVTLASGTSQSVTSIENAADATIYGAEFEFTFVPTDRLELSGFYNYLNASYDEFISPTLGDISSFPLANTPENTFSATVRYTLPLPESIGALSVHGNYWWTDEYAWGDAFDPFAVTDSYGLFNARVDWRNILGSSFDVALYGRNLADEEYYLPGLSLQLAPVSVPQSTPFGFTAGIPGDPRTWGVEVSYRFGGTAE